MILMAASNRGCAPIVEQLEGTADIPPQAASPSGNGSGLGLEGPDLDLIPGSSSVVLFLALSGCLPGWASLHPAWAWFLYLFLIPFWAMFPIVVIGMQATLVVLIIYLVGFPIAKIIISRKKWYLKAKKSLKKKGRARIGGFTFLSGGRSSGSSSGSWGSSGSSFSGGGGSSGGGGASGSW